MDKLKDKAEGAVDKAKGQGEEAAGNATNDQTKKAQGTICLLYTSTLPTKRIV